MTKNKHIGSSFDDFLDEEGILEESKDEASKRVMGWQLEKKMKKTTLNKRRICQTHAY